MSLHFCFINTPPLLPFLVSSIPLTFLQFLSLSFFLCRACPLSLPMLPVCSLVSCCLQQTPARFQLCVLNDNKLKQPPACLSFPSNTLQPPNLQTPTVDSLNIHLQQEKSFSWVWILQKNSILWPGQSTTYCKRHWDNKKSSRNTGYFYDVAMNLNDLYEYDGNATLISNSHIHQHFMHTTVQSEWVRKALNPEERLLDPPTPPPPLLHLSPTDMARVQSEKDRAIQKESHVVLQHKRQQYLLNVRQQCNRKKTVKLYSVHFTVWGTRVDGVRIWLQFKSCWVRCLGAIHIIAEWSKFKQCLQMLPLSY